jgi:hypothetical protein
MVILPNGYVDVFWAGSGVGKSGRVLGSKETYSSLQAKGSKFPHSGGDSGNPDSEVRI